MTVFSRKSFFSHNALVVSGVIALYRVFLKMLDVILKLRKVQQTIIWTTKVGELVCGPCVCGPNLKFSRSRFHS